MKGNDKQQPEHISEPLRRVMNTLIMALAPGDKPEQKEARQIIANLTQRPG